MNDGYLFVYIHCYLPIFMFAQLAFIIKKLDYITILSKHLNVTCSFIKDDTSEMTLGPNKVAGRDF